MKVINSVSQADINDRQRRQNLVKANKNKVMMASIAGSAIGIAGAVAGVYKMAKKSNPAVSFKNFNYNEKDLLMLGTGSVLGGLTGGLIADKNRDNVKPKLREASQQLVGNLAFPLAFLAVGQTLLEKSKLQLPKINSNSKPAKVANAVLGVLPKIVVTVGSLLGGMKVGGAVVNKVSNKVFKEDVKQEKVDPEDMLMHADDALLMVNELAKNSKVVSAFSSGAMPAIFIVSGAKTGMQEQEPLF